MKKRFVLVLVFLIGMFTMIGSMSYAYNLKLFAVPEKGKESSSYSFFTSVKASSHAKANYSINQFKDYITAGLGTSDLYYDIVGYYFHTKPNTNYEKTSEAYTMWEDEDTVPKSFVVGYDVFNQTVQIDSEDSHVTQISKVGPYYTSATVSKAKITPSGEEDKLGGNYYNDHIEVALDGSGDNVIFKYTISYELIKKFVDSNNVQIETFDGKKYYKIYVSFVTKFKHGTSYTAWQFYDNLKRAIQNELCNWTSGVIGAKPGTSAVNDFDNILYIPIEEKEINVNYYKIDKDNELSIIQNVANKRSTNKDLYHTFPEALLVTGKTNPERNSQYERFTFNLDDNEKFYPKPVLPDKEPGLTELKGYEYVGARYAIAKDNENYSALETIVKNEFKANGEVQVKPTQSLDVPLKNSKTVLVSFIYKAPKPEIEVVIHHIDKANCSKESYKKNLLPFAKDKPKSGNIGNELKVYKDKTQEKDVLELSKRDKYESVYKLNSSSVNLMDFHNYIGKETAQESGKDVEYTFTGEVKIVPVKGEEEIWTEPIKNTDPSKYGKDVKDYVYKGFPLKDSSPYNKYIVLFLYERKVIGEKEIYVNYLQEAQKKLSVLMVAPKTMNPPHKFSVGGKSVGIKNVSLESSEYEQYEFKLLDYKKYIDKGDFPVFTATYMDDGEDKELMKKTGVKYTYIRHEYKSDEAGTGYPVLRDAILNGKSDGKSSKNYKDIKIKDDKPILVSFIYKVSVQNVDIKIEHAKKSDWNALLPFANNYPKSGNRGNYLKPEGPVTVTKKEDKVTYYTVDVSKLKTDLTAENAISEGKVEEKGRKVKYVFTGEAVLYKYKKVGTPEIEIITGIEDTKKFDFPVIEQPYVEYEIKFLYAVDGAEEVDLYVNYVEDTAGIRSVLLVSPKNKFGKQGEVEYSQRHQFSEKGDSESAYRDVKEDDDFVFDISNNEYEHYRFNLADYADKKLVFKAIYMSNNELNSKVSGSNKYKFDHYEYIKNQDTYEQLRNSILNGNSAGDDSSTYKVGSKNDIDMKISISKTNIEPAALVSFIYKSSVEDVKVIIQHQTKSGRILPIASEKSNCYTDDCKDLGRANNLVGNPEKYTGTKQQLIKTTSDRHYIYKYDFSKVKGGQYVIENGSTLVSPSSYSDKSTQKYSYPYSYYNSKINSYKVCSDVADVGYAHNSNNYYDYNYDYYYNYGNNYDNETRNRLNNGGSIINDKVYYNCTNIVSEGPTVTTDVNEEYRLVHGTFNTVDVTSSSTTEIVYTAKLSELNYMIASNCLIGENIEIGENKYSYTGDIKIEKKLSKGTKFSESARGTSVKLSGKESPYIEYKIIFYYDSDDADIDVDGDDDDCEDDECYCGCDPDEDPLCRGDCVTKACATLTVTADDLKYVPSDAKCDFETEEKCGDEVESTTYITSGQNITATLKVNRPYYINPDYGIYQVVSVTPQRVEILTEDKILDPMETGKCTHNECVAHYPTYKCTDEDGNEKTCGGGCKERKDIEYSYTTGGELVEQLTPEAIAAAKKEIDFWLAYYKSANNKIDYLVNNDGKSVKAIESEGDINITVSGQCASHEGGKHGAEVVMKRKGHYFYINKVTVKVVGFKALFLKEAYIAEFDEKKDDNCRGGSSHAPEYCEDFETNQFNFGLGRISGASLRGTPTSENMRIEFDIKGKQNQEDVYNRIKEKFEIEGDNGICYNGYQFSDVTGWSCRSWKPIVPLYEHISGMSHAKSKLYWSKRQIDDINNSVESEYIYENKELWSNPTGYNTLSQSQARAYYTTLFREVVKENEKHLIQDQERRKVTDPRTPFDRAYFLKSVSVENNNPKDSSYDSMIKSSGLLRQLDFKADRTIKNFTSFQTRYCDEEHYYYTDSNKCRKLGKKTNLAGINIMNPAQLVEHKDSLDYSKEIVVHTLSDIDTFNLEVGAPVTIKPVLSNKDQKYPNLSFSERRKYIGYYIFKFNFPVSIPESTGDKKYNENISVHGIYYDVDAKETYVCIKVGNEILKDGNVAHDSTLGPGFSGVKLTVIPTGYTSEKDDSYMTSNVNLKQNVIEFLAATINVPADPSSHGLYSNIKGVLYNHDLVLTSMLYTLGKTVEIIDEKEQDGRNVKYIKLTDTTSKSFTVQHNLTEGRRFVYTGSASTKALVELRISKVCDAQGVLDIAHSEEIGWGHGFGVHNDSAYFSNRIIFKSTNISRVYDFRVTDCTDVNYKNVFRKSTVETVNEHTGTVYYGGTRLLDVYANVDSDSSLVPHYKNTVMPLGPYKQPYVDAPKLGYRISFDLKTSGYYEYGNRLGQKRTIVICPKLYYISKDGSKFIPNVDAYYKKSSGKYVKIPQITSNNINNADFYKTRMTSPLGGYQITFTPNDGYRNVLNLGITNVDDHFTNKKRVIDTSSIVIDEDMMCQNYDGFIQSWYGEYKLPNSTILVDPADENNGKDLNNYLRDGYCGVVFYIAVIEQRGSGDSVVIAYHAPDKRKASTYNTSQWDYEGALGFEKSNIGNELEGELKLQLAKGIWTINKDDMYQQVKGTVILYDLDNRAASDFE